MPSGPAALDRCHALEPELEPGLEHTLPEHAPLERAEVAAALRKTPAHVARPVRSLAGPRPSRRSPKKRPYSG